MGLKPPPRKREGNSGVKSRVYSESEVGELRIEWERDRREQTFTEALSKLTGQYESLPNLIEATARRVFQDMFRDVQAQAASVQQKVTQERWRRADTLIVSGQMILGLILLLQQLRMR